MKRSDPNFSIAIVDDNAEFLEKLRSALERDLVGEKVELREWRPVDGQNPVEFFNGMVDNNTLLVVTDYDLTKGGMTGMFGANVISWCQDKLIPVGDFSRQNIGTTELKEDALFEFRIPTDIENSASFASRLFRGFRSLRELLSGDDIDLQTIRGPAQAMAIVLGRPEEENLFALYMPPLGAANAPLAASLRAGANQDKNPDDTERVRLLSYVVGHILANAVLRYCGPILSPEAMCAYVAAPFSERESIGGIFGDALYRGPFSHGLNYYWRSNVDQLIAVEAAEIQDEVEYESSGARNRAVVEIMLHRKLATHDCTRCGGVNGGYLCPFTKRPVCERIDCSVASNNWIPAGATASRIEKDFYDEWAPILGF